MEENNKSNNNCILANVRSKYILKAIFDYLQEYNSLNIILYNKNIQNKLDINIKDYKELSKIEIEVEMEIPKDDEFKFINISDENYIHYFHMYLDNKNNEIKRDYVTKGDKFKKIIIIIDCEIKSLNKLFERCKYIKKVNFIKFIRNNINDMSHMFDGCESIKELNLSNIITNNVTNMSCMFNGCSKLFKLNVENFNTSNVTDMSEMFC